MGENSVLTAPRARRADDERSKVTGFVARSLRALGQTLVPPRTLPPPPSDLVGSPSGGGPASLRLRWLDRDGFHAVAIDRRLILGSSENVDVVIADAAVSRIHVEIEPMLDRVVIRDVSSRNGTFIDGVRIESARLVAGNVLRVGKTPLYVEATDASARVEPWPESRFRSLVGQSKVMRELFATVSNVACSDASVLIRGETGSGKELVARSIHEASRASLPFVVIDCGALSENLLESELFGHARGAFTGATSARQGAIESAGAGTIFLDEVGELPLTMQPKLLRLLESRTVRRVGESEHRRTNVRFISATHRDLVEHVARGEFREDLYFRLAVLPVRVPPLRERPEDIELLVREFAGQDADRLATPALLEELRSRPWRGNVRELRNVIDRVRAFGVDSLGTWADEDGDSARTSEITKTSMVVEASGPGLSLAPFSAPPELFDLTYKEFRERFAHLGEREYLRRRLERCDGNVSQAARSVEVARTYLHKLLRRNGF